MTKRYQLLLVVVVLFALVLSACGPAASDDVAADEEMTDEEMTDEEMADEEMADEEMADEEMADEVVCEHRIGFVTDVGKLNDQSFNQGGYEGVQAGAAALGLGEECYSFIETQDSADYIPNIESFIDEGYDIIVTSGFAMGAATREAGRAHPEVFFIGTDQGQVDENFAPDPIDNVQGIIYHEDVSGFLAGALAGLLTETDVVGGIYGCPFIPPVARFEVGYYNGVKHVNPDAEVINIYHPGSIDVCFVDPEWAAETADSILAEGADVIFGAGGLTGNGALIGACEAGQAVIGVDVDQYGSLPEVQSCIASSATKDLVGSVSAGIQSVADGTFVGGDVFGAALLAPFHEYEDVITDEMKAQLDDISSQIDAGDIDPCAPFDGSNEATGCSPVVQ